MRRVTGSHVPRYQLTKRVVSLTAVERWWATVAPQALSAWREAMAEVPWSYGDAEYTLVPVTRFLGHLDAQLPDHAEIIELLTVVLDGVDCLDLEG